MNRPRGAAFELSAFGAIVLMAGLNVVAIRVSNRELPPFWGAALRLATTSLLMAALMILFRLPLPERGRISTAASYGLLAFGVSAALAYWALQFVSAAIGAMLIALVPLLTFFLAVFHGLIPFTWRPLIGAVIALFGIAIAVSDRVGPEPSLPALLALGASSIFLAEAVLVLGRNPAPGPIPLAAVATASGAVVVLPVSLVANEHWSIPTAAPTWLALAYLVLFGSVVYAALSVFVIGRWGATQASYQFVLAPIVASLAAATLAGEPVTGTFVLGAVFTCVGVHIGVRFDARSAHGRIQPTGQSWRAHQYSTQDEE